MAKITTKEKVFEKVSESDLKNYSQNCIKVCCRIKVLDLKTIQTSIQRR